MYVHIYMCVCVSLKLMYCNNIVLQNECVA